MISIELCCSQKRRCWWISGRNGAGHAARLRQSLSLVAEHYAGAAHVFKLNVDDSSAVMERYGIQGIPTLILFQDGVEKERIVGVALNRPCHTWPVER